MPYRVKRKPVPSAGRPGGVVTSTPGPFRPNVRLNPSRIRDRRGTTQSALENAGVAVMGAINTVRTNMGKMLGGRDHMREGAGRLNDVRPVKRMWAPPKSKGPFVTSVRLDPSRVVDSRPVPRRPARQFTVDRRNIKAMSVPRVGDILRGEPNLIQGASMATVDMFRKAVRMMNNQLESAGGRPIDMPGRMRNSMKLHRPLKQTTKGISLNYRKAGR